MKATAVLLILVTTSLAGCISSEAGGPKEQASDGGPRAAEPATFGESTGAIQGLVVDDAINPIAGAIVGVKETDASTTTDAGGRFAFSQLEPGTYTVLANALGYSAVARTVDVVPGELVEVQLTLEALAVVEPYYVVQTFAGLIECAWGLSGAGSGNCLPIQFLIQQYNLSNPTNTRIIGLYAISEPQKVVQGVFEMVWNPSAATTSGQLLLTVELERTGVINGKTYATSQGPSPVKVVTGPEPFKDLKPDQKLDKVQTRTFPAQTNPPTVVVNQRFTVYATACYLLECGDLYSAVRDA